jgi:HK97 gp10 family phage protein
MNNSGIKIEGIDEVIAALEQLSKGVGERALSDVFREAAKIVKEDLKANAPARRLKKNKVIPIRARRGAVTVGYSKAGYIARFYERGTKSRKLLGRGKYKKGTNRGVFRSRPFVERTFKAALPKIESLIMNQTKKIMSRSLERYSKRLSKKLGRE